MKDQRNLTGRGAWLLLATLALALAMAGCGGGTDGQDAAASDDSAAIHDGADADEGGDVRRDSAGDLPADPGSSDGADPGETAGDSAGDADMPPAGPIPVACTSSDDCRLACAQGFCDTAHQRCAFVPKPGRCVLSEGPLDDGLVACFATGQASPVRPCLFCQPALAQDRWTGAAFFDDLEQPGAEWIVLDATGSGIAWHRSNRRSGRGTWSLHAGSDGGPYGGWAAVDTSVTRELDVPDVAGVRLRFDLWLQTEGTPGYDLLEVEIAPSGPGAPGQGTAAWTSDAIGGTTGGIFRQQQVDLDAWRGQRMRVTLRFRTGDDKINQFEGAYVDALEVWSGCCAGDAECDDRDPCTEESCLADGSGCASTALPDCCAADPDCDDGDPCTLDTCPVSGGSCAHEGVTPCCGADADCDDADPCTIDTCPVSGGECQHLTTCCEEDPDCQNGAPCTQGFCQAGACVYVDTCCHANADCDDGELCTKDTCLASGACSYKPAYLPGCCVPELHQEDFDDPSLADFTFTGGAGLVTWQHVLGERAKSAPGALYYGDLAAKSYDAGGGDDWDDGDDWDWGWYGGGSEGDAEIGPLLLPPGVGLTLRFALWIDVETCCDRLSLRLDDGVEEAEVWKSSSSTPQQQWTEIEVDVSSYAGRAVTLRFHFYADSSVFKEGAWVDDLRLVTSCGPRACAKDGDCVAWGSCWEGACKGGVCTYGSRCCEDDAACDDDDPCTVDACEGTFCVHDAIDECCSVGADCDDGNPCTADACPGVGEPCAHAPIEGCCLGDGQCDDGDACTYDRCRDLACSHAPACCQDDADCDDHEDLCTADRCVEGACLYEATWAEGCCYAEPYSESFEVAAVAGYTFSGGLDDVGWQVVQGLEAATGVGALYYGDPDALSYSTSGGNEGSALSPPIVLPPGTALELAFNFWQHTESSASWDYTEVWVYVGERAVRVWKKASSTPQQQWTEIHADLSPFGGQTVRLEFRFKADGSISYEGVFIDDVRVTSSCSPKPCQAAADCPTPDTCWKGTCAAGACAYELTCCLTGADCGDEDLCTEDTCAATGCKHTAIAGCCAADADCDDGDVCTTDACPVPGESCTFTPIPACCHGHADCDDQDACTRDRCDALVCTHVDECCASDADCDDGDPCRVGACAEGRCAWSPTEAQGCCQGSAFQSDFEAGLPASVTLDPPDEDGVGWRVASGGEVLGEDAALYFGDPAAWSYDTDSAVSGSARLTGVALAPGVPWALTFEINLDVGDTGTAYDAFTVSVLLDGASHVVWTKKDLGALHAWESHVVDLSAFGGHAIDLVFRFDSKDATNNGGAGVFLDDVTLTSACLPRACLLDADCADGFAFSTDRCEAAGCAWTLPGAGAGGG